MEHITRKRKFMGSFKLWLEKDNDKEGQHALLCAFLCATLN
jgi:hypothetical protein